MKELTIEQKAKAYDEAIEKGKQIQNYPYTAHWDIMKEVVELLFPKLKADEKIRKALIKYYSFDKDGGSHALDNITPEQIVDWLEKQGQKEYTFKSLPRLLDMIEPTSRAKAYCQKLMNALVKEGYSTDAKIVGECLKKMNGEDVPMAIMDGEPIEVNPTEFDLRLNRLLKQFETLSKEELASSLSFYLNVVQNDRTYKDAEKQCGQKPFDYENANIQQKDFAPKIEPKFSVGDWIVQENIGVYKVIEICESWYEVINSEDEHYSISFDKEHMCHFWNISDAKDGDVLYENYSNTVLIFKSQTYGRVKVYCDFWTNKNKFTGTNSSDYGRVSEMDLKPATKEQRNILFQKMKESGYTFDFEKKELKKIDMQELVKQDSVWGEEDERIFDGLTAIVEDWYNAESEEEKEYYGDCGYINWLKTIKERYTWKPSKEQVIALRWVLNNIPYNKHKEEISGLLYQIHKLGEDR